jgi:hypothetical protein
MIDTTPQPEAQNPIFRDVESAGKKELKFQKSFLFEYRSEDEDRTFSGEFTVKRLNLGDSSRIGVRIAQLNAGEDVNPQVHFLHNMIAYCEAALVVVPDWWKPAEFYDVQILRKMYDYVYAFNDNFRKRRVE